MTFISNLPDPEEIAIQALGFFAQDPERLARFLAITGLTPQSLRASARDAGFVPAILAYLGQDEALMLAFCAEIDLAPERLAPLLANG